MHLDYTSSVQSNNTTPSDHSITHPETLERRKHDATRFRCIREYCRAYITSNTYTLRRYFNKQQREAYDDFLFHKIGGGEDFTAPIGKIKDILVTTFSKRHVTDRHILMYLDVVYKIYTQNLKHRVYVTMISDVEYADILSRFIYEYTDYNPRPRFGRVESFLRFIIGRL